MSALDPRALRSAFGRFMTGVTVVTTRDKNGNPLGFTANSFSSVSMDPPLLLVCPGKFLSSYATFAGCEHFAVNILAEGQEDVSNIFASFKGDRFAKVTHHDDLHGIPVLDGALARFSCSMHSFTEAGDHGILVGRIRDFEQHDGHGLGYASGQYFSLGLERAALEHTKGMTVCGAIIGDAGRVLLEKTANGYRPLQVTLEGRNNLRSSLCADLETRGISIELGQAYSVFDDRQSALHHVYFLGNGMPEVVPSPIESVPIDRLSEVTYASPTISQMMTRYAVEARTRSFGLYLGDEQHGDVHKPTDRI